MGKYSKRKKKHSPKLQDIKVDKIPTITSNGLNMKVYTGSLEGLTSPVVTNVPLIIADIQLEAGTTTTLHIPANYTTFLYNIKGNILVGEDQKNLNQYHHFL